MAIWMVLLKPKLGLCYNRTKRDYASRRRSIVEKKGDLMNDQPDFQPTETKPEEGIVHKFTQLREKKNWREILLPAGAILAIIVAGTVTGYFLVNRGGFGPTEVRKLEEGVEMVTGPKEVGIKDIRVFRDTASGKVEVNDNEVVTEGSHKLIRPGGESQTAYLTSSVVDLNQFLGKCVQVWGETFSAQKAGWLMDVGRVKILDRCPEGV